MIKLFGRKKKTEEAMPVSGKGIIPTERIKDLSSKGFSEPEMIDVLRKEGYSPEEIDKALTESLKSGVSKEPTSSFGLPTMEQLPLTQPNLPTQEQPVMPTIPEPSIQQQYYPQEYNYPTEEVVESVVREKMSKIDEKLMEFKMQYSDLDAKIKDIHNRLDSLIKGKSEGEKETSAKLEALKDSIAAMDGKISSLEKAFKETLPALIESVRALSDLVQRVKREG